MVSFSPNVRWFESLRLEDLPLVGGKNASLGELYSELSKSGVRVPNGCRRLRRRVDFGRGVELIACATR